MNDRLVLTLIAFSCVLGCSSPSSNDGGVPPQTDAGAPEDGGAPGIDGGVLRPDGGVSPDSDAGPADSGPSTMLLLYGGLGPYADGGNNELTLSDTWIFQDGAWKQEPGSGPALAGGATMAAVGGNPILFGGEDPSTGNSLGNTWRWSATGGWTQLNVNGPMARQDADSASLGGGMLMFGGVNIISDLGATLLGDTWMFNGTAWTQVSTTGPSPRSDTVFAPTGSGVLLFGGTSMQGDLGDTWQWNGTGWSMLQVSGPSARLYAAATSFRGKVVVFGGESMTGNELGDTWEWDGTAWTQKMVSGPPARQQAVFAVAGDQAILFGGTTGIDASDTLGDTWAWDGTAWTQLPVQGPSPRSSAVAISL